MLTLKAPIQLHIGKGLAADMDTFGERIRGNYNILGARYAPKDLLFLLTAPPELPEETGGMTTLVTQQNRVDIRSVTMDVVNNVVNRILLDGTQQFTYQDQVYITSVLNRLGITDVQQFMQQVRQLRSENENTVQLTRLYRSHVEKILQRQAEGEEAPTLPLPQQAAQDDTRPRQDPRVAMSMEILQRLDTTNLYETVHSFQRNWSRQDNHFQHNEFRLAEQLRFSNAVSLAEIKQQVYQQPQLHLRHHLNQYETNVLLEAPRDEEAVLSQAAAAALITAVDNTVTEVLNRPTLRQEQWVRIQNAIWQTAENTISRFETYHSQYQLPAETVRPDPQVAWNYYLQELQEYQTLYRQLYPRAAEHGRMIGLPPMTHQQMIHLIRMEEGDRILQELESHHHMTQPGAVLRELRTVQEPQSRPAEPAAARLVFREEFHTQETEHLQELRTHESDGMTRETERTLETLQALRERRTTETVRTETEPPLTLTPRSSGEMEPTLTVEETQLLEQYDTLLQTLQQEPRRPAGEPAEREVLSRLVQETLRKPEETERILREVHSREQTRMVHTVLPGEEEDAPSAADDGRELRETLLAQQKETRERELQKLREVMTGQAEPAARTAETVAGALERFRTVREMEPAPEQPEQPVTLTPREAEVQSPELLVEEINRIDQHNRTVLQTLQQEARRRETPVLTGPDVQRTMRDALRALEEPGSVVRELYSRQETELVHPDYTPQEETLLRQADPATRLVYEKILAYQRDPEGALAKGLIRAANMGTLQAELQRASQDTPLQLEHLERPAQTEQRLPEQSEVILEQFRSRPVRQLRQEPPVRTPDAVRFVHKQAATEVTEELLEQLQQQRTQSTVQKMVTEQEITQQKTHQVDVHQMEHKVVTQTTEDITELVNRTLSRQMRTISDQVYRQMEKRLQSERNRRGRF